MIFEKIGITFYFNCIKEKESNKKVFLPKSKDQLYRILKKDVEKVFRFLNLKPKKICTLKNQFTLSIDNQD